MVTRTMTSGAAAVERSLRSARSLSASSPPSARNTKAAAEMHSATAEPTVHATESTTARDEMQLDSAPRPGERDDSAHCRERHG
jgi:hypothetical protein